GNSISVHWVRSAPGYDTLKRGYSSKFVLATFLLASFFLTAFYHTELVVRVTHPKLWSDIQTAAEVLDSDLHLNMPEVALTLLRNDQDVHHRLLDHIGPSSSLATKSYAAAFEDSFLAGLVTRHDSAMLENIDVYNFYRSVVQRRDGTCPLHGVKGCYATYLESPVLFRRGHPLLPGTSRLWLRFLETGLFARWYGLFVVPQASCPIYPRPLRLQNLEPAFYMLFCGFVLSAASFAWEKVLAEYRPLV
ncbi:hypothetical protein FOCC_FOCC015104, partial [Frankliniella occidentalis]